MRSTTRLLSLLVSLWLIPGCSVDGVSAPEPSGDGPDAGTIARDCTVPASFGTVGALSGNAEAVQQQSGTGTLYRFNADLDDATPKDSLALQLWEGRGLFAAGVITGSFPLGDAADFSTCAACVTIVGDIVPMQGPTQFYIAQSGTLTIDSLTPTLSGSVSGLTLVEFDLATGIPVTGGCDTRIESASFSGTLQ